eukprot:jgi/Psemu1/291988/fgenesh1_pg.881_\
MSSVIDDGWGDEEELDISDKNVAEGWGDDEDLDVSGDNAGDGWGEDDDFFNDDDTDADVSPPAPAAASADTILSRTKVDDSPADLESHQFTVDQSGRPHVGDKRSDALQCENTIPPPPPHPRHASKDINIRPNGSQMIAELSHYINSLDRMLSSINAVLEFEYNTFQKADELVEYYQSRPQLAEYTRTKELARMDYEVILPYGHVETSKEQIIADNLLPDHAIVSRAANQSLLADLLQVITGQDLIVRPQYMTICVATWCKFTIHQGDNGADMVDCRAKLSLSMPTADGDRLHVAEVTVCVLFSPSRPMVEFRVQKIDVVLEDYSKLAGVTEFLSEMENNNGESEFVNVSPDMYRDAFLEKSQRLLSLSSVGMMSAIQQVDSVVNIKGKLKQISSFIPDTDQLLEVEQETIAFAEARKEEMDHQRKQQELSATSFPRPLPPPPPPRAPNHPYDSSENALQGNDVERPKSILGGLVRSGWKTLAKSVAIPDEDPAIYGEPVPPPPPPFPLYNKPTERHMRNKDDTYTSTEQMIPNQEIPIDATMGRPQVEFGREDYPNEKQRYDDSAGPPNDNNILGRNLVPPHPPPQSVPKLLSANADGKIQHNQNRIQNNSFDAEEIGGKDEETNTGEATDNDETENVVDDGWDDFGFDEDEDADDRGGTDGNGQDAFDLPKTSTEKGSEEEFGIHSPDVSIAKSPHATETTISTTDSKDYPEDLMFQTRKRWVNPRPYRPYVKG